MPTNDLPEGLTEYTIDYIAAIAAGHDTPDPPAHFAHDSAAWWTVQWAMTKLTVHMLRELTPEAGTGEGSWAFHVAYAPDGPDGPEHPVDVDDAPPEVALAGRFLACALNDDNSTAMALARVHAVEVVWEAFDAIAQHCRLLALELGWTDQ